MGDTADYQLIRGKRVVVRVRDGHPYEPDSLIAEANRIWDAARVVNPRLFDSQILICRGLESRNSAIEVVCEATSYRYYYAQRRGGLAFGLLPVAVSGAVRVVEKNASTWLFARRGQNVTQYPGYFELVPSGGIEAGDVDAEGIADYRSRLMSELQSETGLEPSLIDDVNDLGVVTDRVDPVMNILCAMTIHNSVAAVERALCVGPEYPTFFLIPDSKLGEFLSSNPALVPTSRAALDMMRSIPQ